MFSQLMQTGGMHGINSGNKCISDFHDELGHDIVKECTIVSSVRNPYDRIHSVWAYAFAPRIDFKNYMGMLEANENAIMGMASSEFLSANNLAKNGFPSLGFIPMVDYMKHPKYTVDIILSVDDMRRSLGLLSSLLGRDVKLPPKINCSRRFSPSADEAREISRYVEIINRMYDKDFAEFGYRQIEP
jgi:hypothetical protein